MKEYPKIQSIFRRDEGTHKFIEGEWARPELEYLKDNLWEAPEKIDGTNTRVDWNAEKQEVRFGGRTDNAQIPTFLLTRLQDIFPKEKFIENYPEVSMTLYGEGYGAKIQKGGGNYNPNGVDIVLFDVLIDGWWLYRNNIEDIASKLNIKCVPIVNDGCTLMDAIEHIKVGFHSQYGDFVAEGMVLKPLAMLFSRKGGRIMAKVKHRDF